MCDLYKEYLESGETDLEYFDWLDNQILLRSRDRKIEEANKKIKERFKIRVYKSFTLPLNTSNKKYINHIIGNIPIVIILSLLIIFFMSSSY